MVSEMETDINARNTYINRRYDVVYEGGIMTGLRIKSGFDRTQYNYLPRVVDVHAAQVMGRLPQITTRFDTEDLSSFDLGHQPGSPPDPAAEAAKLQAKVRNAQKAAAAEVRTVALRNLMQENKWEEVSDRAAHIQAWAGFCVFKTWKDAAAKTWRMSLLETPQNFVRVWANSNFREHDADIYMYQISAARARRLYGDKLKPGEVFAESAVGQAWQRSPQSVDLERDLIKKVWVIDVTGYIPGIAPSGDSDVQIVDNGKEEQVSALIVGDKVVQIMTKDLPLYTVINGEEEVGKPWGKSCISDELIQVNQTMIETMSDWRTASWKVSFPKLKFIGFDEVDLPALSDRDAQALPLPDLGQDVQPIAMPNTLQEFERLMETLWDAFTKLAKVSRVMLDDPSVNTASNAGMMTSMKPLIDVTEAKQKRWSVGLNEMFTSALNSITGFDEALKQAIADQNWQLQVKWPSVLRKEDATYQQMYLNRWNSNTISVRSFIEAMGDDPDDELDRMRDDLTDPTTAAMMGRMLGMIASVNINKSLGLPAQGFVQPRVQLRGELPPQEVGNIANFYSWDQGPYGSAIGPQGNQGASANANWENSGLISGGNGNQQMPNYQTAPNPTLTPDQNTGQQAVSQPGSGATGVSAQGAINQVAQQGGR